VLPVVYNRWLIAYIFIFSPSFSDNIESNVFSIASDTQGAVEELSTASEYQRKAGRRAACLMVILVVVVAIVLLAVRVFETLAIGC